MELVHQSIYSEDGNEDLVPPFIQQMIISTGAVAEGDEGLWPVAVLPLYYDFPRDDMLSYKFKLGGMSWVEQSRPPTPNTSPKR